MAAEGPAVDPPLAPPSSDAPPLFPGLPWWALPFRALRHRNYRLYFVGQLISVIGSWVQTTALMWLAYRLTRQSQWPALVVDGADAADVLSGGLGRRPGRPRLEAGADLQHAGGAAGAGRAAGRPGAGRARQPLAPARHQPRCRRRQRHRLAGPAVVRHGHGRSRGPRQRRRPQLAAVQRGPGGGARHRRRADPPGAGPMLPGQRPQLRRGAGGPGPDGRERHVALPRRDPACGPCSTGGATSPAGRRWPACWR